MKREKYFRDELRKLFISYAIVPAVVFTFVCGLIFMAAFFCGKKRANAAQNRYAASEWERVLLEYKRALETISSVPELLSGELDERRRVELFENFYAVSGRLGYEADFFVLDQDRELILGSGREVPGFLEIEPGTEWGLYAAMDGRPGETVIRLAEPWKSQKKLLALGRALSFPDSDLPAGYAVITIGSGQFQPMLDRSDTQTILADRFGWVYAGNHYNFVDSSNQIVRKLRREGPFFTYENHLYLVLKKPVYHSQFMVFTISDLQNIVVSLGIGGALLLTALIGMTFWVLLSSRKVTEKKTEDFYRILDVMEQARDGNLDGEIRIGSDNEFRIIADAYHETIASLKRQMENNRRMAELVAISQNKQLESQFNPHFLYNTLENIRYMCKIEPSIAEKMIVSLSGLLRYSLDAGKEEVTVREDLEHLENYLTILKYRFNRRLSCRIEVEPEAMDCRIPKLVLQPMIENSVKYGFGKQETLLVELKAYLHEENLVLICRDDGVGMTPGTLRELTELLQQEKNTSRHSGLYNIHRRIQILCGRPFGVEVRSAEGHGTTLVVTLPAHREESNAAGISGGG